MNSIELIRKVNNWRLGEKIINSIPPGTYFLTLSIQWDGPKEGPQRITLIEEHPEGRYSAFVIGDESDLNGLKDYADYLGFKAVEDSHINGKPTVYIKIVEKLIADWIEKPSPPGFAKPQPLLSPKMKGM